MTPLHWKVPRWINPIPFCIVTQPLYINESLVLNLHQGSYISKVLLVPSYLRMTFSQCARYPELLEYPHAILYDKFWNSTLSNFIKIHYMGVPKVCLKYGMWVLKQLRLTSTLWILMKLAIEKEEEESNCVQTSMLIMSIHWPRCPDWNDAPHALCMSHTGPHSLFPCATSSRSTWSVVKDLQISNISICYCFAALAVAHNSAVASLAGSFLPRD